VTSTLVAWVGTALLSSSLGLVVWTFAQPTVADAPDLGLRGFERHEALASSWMFRTFEPMIRFVAGWFRVLPLSGLRARADRRLWQAGDFMGLTPDEWFALIFISTLGGAVSGGLLMLLIELPALFIPVLAGLGAFVSYNGVPESTATRRRRVARGLPNTIDLLALCISAGMSFPQGLADVVRQALSRDPLTIEMRHILRHLEVGHSRAFALKSFAERVPVEAVADFTSAVIQAEARGTPIKDVLKTQATMLRMRRTIQVEEEAAAAGVKLTLPLALMLISVLVLIAAPMLLRATAFLS